MAEIGNRANGFVLLTCDTRGEGGLRCIPIPAGVSYLRVVRGRPRLTKKRPPRGGAGFLIEPLSLGHRAALLLLTAPGHRARRNGTAAPRAAVRVEGDQRHLDGTAGAAHVSRRRRRLVGPPAKEIVGSACPICLARFREDTTGACCGHCGQPLHLEGEDRGEERLDCALVSPLCPYCQREMDSPHQAGLTYVPEGMEVRT